MSNLLKQQGSIACKTQETYQDMEKKIIKIKVTAGFNYVRGESMFCKVFAI